MHSIRRRHISYEHNPTGAGFSFSLRPLRRGAGYRAYDLPWYSPSVHAPRWRRRAYVPGLTLRVMHCAKPAQWEGIRPVRKWYISITKNGNPRYFPAWW